MKLRRIRPLLFSSHVVPRFSAQVAARCRPASQGIILSCLLLLVLTLFLPASLRAQRPGGAQGARPTLPASTGAGETPMNLIVSVRETSGEPLSGNALVKLSSISGGHWTQPTQDASNATFPRMAAGEYEVEVDAVGYKTTTEHVSVFSGGANYTVYVYVQSDSESSSTTPLAPGTPVMAPRLKSEVDKGLEKFKKHQYDAAREQFEKAAKLAPGNPDILYLLGLVEYTQEHYDAARVKFQAALSLYPSHERSLLALGELQLRTGEPATAAVTLEKAYQLNGADWRTHLLLADAYARQKNYEKALPHATRAAELGKDHAAAAWLLAGKILMNENKREEAARAFTNVIRSFPHDPAVKEANTLLSSLNNEQVVLVSINAPATPANSSAAPAAASPSIAGPPPSSPLVAPLPPSSAAMATALPPAAARSWAPPDIDSKEYPAVQDVACSEKELVARTRAKMMRQLGNFEKFIATEHIEHQEVTADGVSGPVRDKDFNYLVFVEHPKPGLSFLSEMRDGGENLGSFPTSLATLGLFSLALNVFGSNFQDDLRYTCEGLGTWRGQAAWRVHFEQKENVPSHIRTWINSHGTYPIALKGRAWINATSYDVLHIETDLREPVAGLQLTRDHLILDYGPVKFQRNATTLWLPWDAEMFLELRGKRYHHTHTLRNYMLFSVDTDNAIAEPQPSSPDERQ